QATHIVVDEIEALHMGRLQRLAEIHALDALEPGYQQGVCPVLNPLGHASIGRAAVAGVVLEAAVGRRVVGWRDHDAIGPSAAAAAIEIENRMGNRWGWRVARLATCFATAGIDARFHAVAGQYL